MALIGNTINVSIPTVGTTTESYTRSSGNLFLTTAYTVGAVDYTATLQLRPAGSLSSTRNFGYTARIAPSSLDDPGSLTKGGVTVAVNVSWTNGSVMTTTELVDFVKESISVALVTDLISDLSVGIAL
jgi:hypothetical protein